MGAALRLLRLVQVAMLASIVLFAAVAEFVGRKHAPENTFFYALSFISISVIGAIMVVRRTLVLQSEDLLKQKPNDALALERWKSGYLFMFSMSELLALLGLVLRLLGFSLAHVWGFYAGGFALLLFFFPSPPHSDFG